MYDKDAFFSKRAVRSMTDWYEQSLRHVLKPVADHGAVIAGKLLGFPLLEQNRTDILNRCFSTFGESHTTSLF